VPKATRVCKIVSYDRRFDPPRYRGVTLASYIQTFSLARGGQSIQLATP